MTTIALLVSWVVSVVFVPYLGYKLLPDFRKAGVHAAPGVVYDKPFYRRFRSVVAWCVEHRWKVIGATAAAFLVAVFAFRFVQQQFSRRLGLMILQIAVRIFVNVRIVKPDLVLLDSRKRVGDLSFACAQ